ncbi:hypothetical protein [Pseudoalteromonas spongiae]|uniref:Uncharacterized protein n=1 Tax=Pseudoalteromonas spongiae TaxID=298657 RepID=A0ABU8F1A4_9GAMM
MNTSAQTNTSHSLVNPTFQRKLDWVMVLLLTVLIIANAYLAHYATINHGAFDVPSKQIAFILGTTFGLPFVAVVATLLFPSMRMLSTQIKVLTLTSAIVFVSNVPLLALAF